MSMRSSHACEAFPDDELAYFPVGAAVSSASAEGPELIRRETALAEQPGLPLE